MIIKSLELENIRSYTSREIHFSKGVTLFVGDIASGKSTILYAIEFALFGLGSLKASFLLRNGAREGQVSLSFESQGVEYVVHRKLVRKAKGVNQGDCFLIESGRKSVLAPGELKERILQILQFNEPASPNAQSLIYRYAIFTPQEEMKEIVGKDPDDRLQTLRRAFRIEDYKQAVENSSLVAGQMGNRITYLKGATQSLEEDKSLQTTNLLEIDSVRKKLQPLMAEQTDKAKKRDDLKKKYDSLQETRNVVSRAQERAVSLTKQMEEKRRVHQKHSAEVTSYLSKLSQEIDPSIKLLEALAPPTTKTKLELRTERKIKSDYLNSLRKLQSKDEERAENFQSIVDKGLCPVCEREAEPNEFKEKAMHVHNEAKSREKEILATEAAIAVIDDLADKVDEFNKNQTRLEDLHSQKKTVMTYVNNIKGLMTEIDDSVIEYQNELEKVKLEAAQSQGILENISRTQQELTLLEQYLQTIGGEIAKSEERISNLEIQNGKLQHQITKEERMVELIVLLEEHRIWTRDFFSKTVESIESHVMTSLNQRFNDQFQRWFQLLVDDQSLQARIDDKFSPITERDEYEQDFKTLSGGERTSVALAYRLALNNTVQEVATGGENLLILDEPTDGFSKQQLYRIRDILHEVKSPQVILVSHENELEAFADQVYKVRKIDGASEIQQ